MAPQSKNQMLIHDMMHSPNNEEYQSLILTGTQQLRLDSNHSSVYGQTLDLNKEGLVLSSHLTSQESQRTSNGNQIEKLLSSQTEWFNI